MNTPPRYTRQQYLAAEENEDHEPNPGVEGVEVGDGGGAALLVGVEVVGVEHGHQPHGGDEERHNLQHRVQHLQPGLALRPEPSVDQNACTNQSIS